ncbi:MAG TPA: zinc-dependent metalloprotease, partial [Actinomycetota bacterium]|nr:zinc-dependent metalloprotease [Actinomycetota bacterium]
LGRPWVRPHLVALVREVAEGMEFDLAALESRLRDLDSPDPTALAEALGDPSELFGGEMTDERRLLLRRVQAFLAAAEGYADHVTDIAARDRLPSFGRIHEAVRRRHEGRPEEERMVERLLGLDVVPEHYRLGRTFCDRVAEVTDEPTLARMWGSTDSMPSMPELEEPTLWLARMA